MRYKTTRYIPENTLPIEEPGLGVIYVSRLMGRDGKWRFAAIAYREKALRSDWNYTFKTDLELDKHVEAWFDGLRQHKQRVVDRRKAEFAGHCFQVGDIVTNSWGYDQTNVDWYLVKRRTQNYVWLKPVVSQLTADEGCSPMSGVESLRLDEHLKPIEGADPETKHRASGDYVTMRHGCGSKWTGEKEYSSWYA